jgi:hypothetical protein
MPTTEIRAIAVGAFLRRGQLPKRPVHEITEKCAFTTTKYTTCRSDSNKINSRIAGHSLGKGDSTSYEQYVQQGIYGRTIGVIRLQDRMIVIRRYRRQFTEAVTLGRRVASGIFTAMPGASKRLGNQDQSMRNTVFVACHAQAFKILRKHHATEEYLETGTPQRFDTGPQANRSAMPLPLPRMHADVNVSQHSGRNNMAKLPSAMLRQVCIEAQLVILAEQLKDLQRARM